jgi:hypothetical protein
MRARRCSDYTGRQFGRLTVLGKGEMRLSRNGARMERWVPVRCLCGAELWTRTMSLIGRVRGKPNTVSCGCRRTKHGETKTWLHRRWSGIKGRCYDVTHNGFHNYGGRGIQMAPEWRDDYIAFRDWIVVNIGMPPDLSYTLDRVNNDGNYEPGNIRWATRKEQHHNTRLTHNPGTGRFEVAA